MNQRLCGTCGKTKQEKDFPYISKGNKSKRKEICRKCDKKSYLSKYYQDNIDDAKKQRKRYYENNKSKVILRTKEWRENNPDKYKKRNKRVAKEFTESMSDKYVSDKLKALGLPVNSETMEIKRMQILIQRELGFGNNPLNINLTNNKQ